MDPLVGTVSAFAQAVPADRVIAFTAKEADDEAILAPAGQAAPSSFRNPPRPADPTGSPDVTFSFTTHGQKLFHDVTATLARRGRPAPTLQEGAVNLLCRDAPAASAPSRATRGRTSASP